MTFRLVFEKKIRFFFFENFRKKLCKLKRGIEGKADGRAGMTGRFKECAVQAEVNTETGRMSAGRWKNALYAYASRIIRCR